MTMTDRSAKRGSKITTFRKTTPNITERFNDKINNDHYSSFQSLSKTDQNFWKQLENYRQKHIKWIEEKRILHDKLKRL